MPTMRLCESSRWTSLKNIRTSLDVGARRFAEPHRRHGRKHLTHPNAHKLWFHFWFSTYGAWIRGDERGFRDVGHRVHSSGVYNNPPPPEEHAGLRRWSQEHMRGPVVEIAGEHRERIGRLLLASFLNEGVRMLALAVLGQHVHGLGRFPSDNARILIGNAKRKSSHGIRNVMPGQVWAKKCGFRQVLDEEYQRSAFQYIIDHRAEGAWVWTFRDAPTHHADDEGSAESSRSNDT